MNRAALATVLLVCLLVTTGCVGFLQGSGQPDTTSTTPTEPDETGTSTTDSSESGEGTRADTDTTESGDVDVVNVSGGEFLYDADVVWRRVQSRLGTNVTPPPVAIETNPLGASHTSGRIVIDPSVARQDSAPILAHEFTHHIQNTAAPWPGRFTEHRDQEFAVAAYKEGLAMYVEDWYRERYDHDSLGSRDVVESSPLSRWYSARYVRGLEYVQYRANHTEELGPLLGGEYPNTTEQVLHPERGFEKAKPLSVRPARVNREGYSDFLPLRSPKRLGELAVRITIWTRTNQSAAVRAGTGWGNDRLLTFQGLDGGGHAWVIRFDDAAETQEAQSLFRAYREGESREFDDPPAAVEETTGLDSRLLNGFLYADRNRSFRTEIVDSETLVVFVGAESFVSNANAFGTRENVTIRVATNETNVSTVEVALRSRATGAPSVTANDVDERFGDSRRGQHRFSTRNGGSDGDVAGERSERLSASHG